MKGVISLRRAFRRSRIHLRCAIMRKNAWILGQMQAFVKAVRKGEAGSPTLRDACQAMVVCEAICDSIERRVAVDVERLKVDYIKLIVGFACAR